MKRLLVSLVVLLLLAPAASLNAQDPPQITLTAPQTIVRGQQFDVVVEISSVTDLAGYSLDLSFDQAILQVVNVSQGSVLSGAGYTAEPLYVTDIDNAAGVVQYTRLLAEPNDPVYTGSGSLAVVRFEAVSSGTTTISFNSSSTLAPGGILLGMLGGQEIAATTQDLTLTIVDSIPVTGVSLSQSSLTMAVGETSTLEATVYPSNATNKNVAWSSSDASVVTVDNGQVTAVAPGTAEITVTTSDGGYTDSCTVTVGATITGTITLDGQAQHGGVTVTTEYSGQIYSATTDDSGNFTLLVPAAATYELSITKDGWTHVSGISATVDLGQNFNAGVVTLYLGDMDGDGSINAGDLTWMLSLVGSSLGDAKYDSRADVNGDQVINILDLLAVLPNVGRSYIQQ